MTEETPGYRPEVRSKYIPKSLNSPSRKLKEYLKGTLITPMGFINRKKAKEELAIRNAAARKEKMNHARYEARKVLQQLRKKYDLSKELHNGKFINDLKSKAGQPLLR